MSYYCVNTVAVGEIPDNCAVRINPTLKYKDPAGDGNREYYYTMEIVDNKGEIVKAADIHLHIDYFTDVKDYALTLMNIVNSVSGAGVDLNLLKKPEETKEE